MGENHEMCEETGKQHRRTHRYIGNGMYEKCGSELERPYKRYLTAKKCDSRRTPEGLKPTAEGEIYLETARKISQLYEGLYFPKMKIF